MTHLENGCKYFKSGHAFDDGDKTKRLKFKEFSHRIFIDAKDLESVSSFTWAGTTFLLIFSRTSPALFFTFNILMIGSEEECKAWKVRLEVSRCRKKDGLGLVAVLYEGPPTSINKGCSTRGSGLPWTKHRGLGGAASMGKMAGVVVNDEMISNVGSFFRGEAFFDLKIKFQQSKEAE